MGYNDTGTLDTGDYVLGRGILYLSEQTDKTKGKSFRDVGNTTEFNLSITEETLEHTSSRTGLSVTDKEVTTSKKVEGTITMDSIEFNNLSIFFSATGEDDKAVTINPNASIDEADAHVLVEANSFALGRHINVVDQDGVQLYNMDATEIDNAASFQLYQDGSPLAAAVYASDGSGDVEWDLEFGTFFIKPTATVIDPTKEIKVAMLQAVVTVGATIDRLNGLAQSSQELSVRFLGENPANNGKQREVQVFKTILRANGDWALIGEDWQTLGFSFTAEVDDQGDILSIVDVNE